MASIHKKKLGSGRVVWELSHGKGKARVRFVAGKTKEEAEAALRLFNRQLGIHGRGPETLTVREAVRSYEEFLQVNRSHSTARRYGRVLRTFAECFLPVRYGAVLNLRDVKPLHLEEYKKGRLLGEIEEVTDDLERERRLREELAANPTAETRAANAKYGWLGRRKLKTTITRKTVNYELQALATFFRWAVKQNLIFANPAEPVERFRLPKRSLPKFMTTEELRLFFAACDPWERRVFSILFLSGMRRGELVNLEWSDVRFDLRVILIREKEEWRPKTDERVIPLTPALEALLREHAKEKRSSRWVVANREGGQEIHLLPKLKKICRKAGITPAAATLHALRHSFGSHLRMAGVPLANIADLMGHKDLATTQIYAKVEMAQLRDAVSRLSPLISTGESDEVSPVCVTRAPFSPRGSRKLLKEKNLEAGNAEWLGGRDSNPDSAVQSRMSYH